MFGQKRLRKELDRIGCRPIVVASHPRSGTHLCIDTLRLNFRQCASWKLCGEPADRLYLDLDRLCDPGAPDPTNLILKVLRRAERPLIKTHKLPNCPARGVTPRFGAGVEAELAAWLRESATYIYLYRDGREVLCSLHRFMRGYAADAEVPLSQFIRQRPGGIGRVREWAEHVRRWVDDPTVYCVAMEELLYCPERALPGLAEKLGLDWKGGSGRQPAKCGSGFIDRLRRRLAFRPQSTAIAPDPRFHRAACWRHAFTHSDRAFFHAEADDLLIALGYEDSDDWVTCSSDARPRFPALFAAQSSRMPTANRAVCCEAVSGR
jgi:hypothetical protein